MELVDFLNRITRIDIDKPLQDFIEKFHVRYDSEMVNLLEVLDSDLGINFLRKETSSHKLIDELINELINKQNSDGNKINIGPISDCILRKYVETIKMGRRVIYLKEQDFEISSTNWEDVPETFSIFCSIVSMTGNEPLIYVRNAGSTSAANLLGRFVYLDDKLKELCQNIFEQEMTAYQDCIVAEVVHLPEDKMGNVLFREITRKYEIPFITESSRPSNFQLPISDIMINVVGTKIAIYSKRLKKRIIPFISTAHNYTLNTQPIYYFLGLLQQHNLRAYFPLKYSSLFYRFDYLPRIMWHSCILEREKWKIKKDYIKKLKLLQGTLLLQEIKQWKKTEVPQYCVYREGDNELLIDFDDARSVTTFISHVKITDIWIEEFLFDEEHAIVKNKDGSFCNEFVFSCYKKHNDE